jgi:monofunctional biosynthetic peptidoglycan transglycosylase
VKTEVSFTKDLILGDAKKAYKGNERGRKIKGGSTISQQTAKNVFLWQGRSYFRKGLEAYFTVLIEFIWGKERMEVYLNSIEMGNGYMALRQQQNIGIERCQRFDTTTSCRNSGILPNPRKFTATSSSSHINNRKRKIMRVMRTVGKIKY